LESMHELLKQQLKLHHGESCPVPAKWRTFLDAVSDSYREFDRNREMLERSLALSSMELLDANSEMSALFQTIPDLLFRLDSDGAILDCKASDTTDFFVPPQELRGRRMQDVSSGQVRRKFLEAIERVKETHSIVQIEYSLSIREQKQYYEARFVPLLEDQITVIVRKITDRKQAEEALRERELKYRALFESAADAIVFLRDHKVSECNESALRLFGCTREQILGKSPHELSPPFQHEGRSSESFAAERLALAMSGTPQYFEWRLLRPDGILFDAEVSLTRMETSGPALALAFIRDITRRKQAEEELRESQQRLSDIIDFLPDATFVVDAESRVIAWNRAMEEMTGIEAEDMLGKGDYEYALPFYAVRKPMLVDVALKPVMDIDADGRSPGGKAGLLSEEVFVPALRGRKAYLFATASLLHDSRGNAVGAVESIRDITERRQVEEALRWAEEKYRSIFENSIAGIFRTTPEGRVISANPAFARIFGYGAPEEMLNLSDVARQIYVNPERREDLIRLADEMDIVQEFEVKILRKDRGTAWVTLNARAVRDESGKISYLEGSIVDITNRKALESRLLQAQKMEAIGALAGGIAHDFNNILAAIMGYAGLAQAKAREKDLRHYLDQILRSCDRAKNLVTQILTFSRKAEQEMTPLDLGPLVKESLKLLRATLPSTIEIRSSIGPGAYTVFGDATQMHQVLINLCTNAAQAMRERGGLLEVSLEWIEVTSHTLFLHHELPPGRYVKLNVSDTGTGISPEVVDRIFDPFFTTKKRGEGTGLGLSVVYGIVKERGGAIAVESEPGEGSVFSVYLPATGSDSESKVERDEPIARGSERILFVDDEEMLVEMVRETLHGMGYRVVATESSVKALKIFRAHPARFDLLITDMTMPGMTGVDLAREVMQIRPDIPVILCTGFSENVSEQQAKNLGIREFIMKPVTVAGLARAVRKALDG